MTSDVIKASQIGADIGDGSMHLQLAAAADVVGNFTDSIKVNGVVTILAMVAVSVVGVVFIVMSVDGASMSGTLVGVKGGNGDLGLVGKNGVFGVVGAGAKLTLSIKNLENVTTGGIRAGIDGQLYVPITVRCKLIGGE